MEVLGAVLLVDALVAGLCLHVSAYSDLLPSLVVLLILVHFIDEDKITDTRISNFGQFFSLSLHFQLFTVRTDVYAVTEGHVLSTTDAGHPLSLDSPRLKKDWRRALLPQVEEESCYLKLERR